MRQRMTLYRQTFEAVCNESVRAMSHSLSPYHFSDDDYGESLADSMRSIVQNGKVVRVWSETNFAFLLWS